jgi:hypothetical protein
MILSRMLTLSIIFHLLSNFIERSARNYSLGLNRDL